MTEVVTWNHKENKAKRIKVYDPDTMLYVFYDGEDLVMVFANSNDEAEATILDWFRHAYGEDSLTFNDIELTFMDAYDIERGEPIFL